MNSDYLVHHGILGQKWGVRRYQNKDGTRTTKGKEKERQESKDKKTHDKAKKAALIVGGVLVVAGGVYLYKSGKLNPILDKFKNKGENKVKDLLDPDSIALAKPMPKESWHNAIYDHIENNNKNCTNCAAETAFRMGGWDVVARSETLSANADDVYAAFKKEPKYVTSPTIDRLKNAIERNVAGGRFKEGDVGVVTCGGFNEDYYKDLAKRGIHIPESERAGHIWMFQIKDGMCEFGDSKRQRNHEQIITHMRKYMGSNKEATFNTLFNANEGIDLASINVEKTNLFVKAK